MAKQLRVLAVGSAGKFAGLVVPELARRGARVRGLVRNLSQADGVLRQGAEEVAVGDLRDRPSLDAALAGIDAVFYIAPAFLPDEAEIGAGMVDAARQAGVRRFVFSSVIDPVISALSNHIAKAPVEEAIISSGMEYALLQPTLFFQNLAEAWPLVVGTGVYTEPRSADSQFSRVDYRDVAEVAAIALSEDRLLYGTYQLCAEGILNRRDMATLMSEVLGRKVMAGSVEHGQVARGGGQPGADAVPPALLRMFEWYDQRGLRGNALTLRAILGREPRTLRQYLEELGPRRSAVG